MSPHCSRRRLSVQQAQICGSIGCAGHQRCGVRFSRRSAHLLLLRGRGWQLAPVAYAAPAGYVSYNSGDRVRVCYWASEYTNWAAYAGNTYVCTPL
jgi:hypothetical protein